MPEPDYLADAQPDHDLKTFAAILALETQITHANEIITARDSQNEQLREIVRSASVEPANPATLDIEQRSVYGRDLLYPIGDLAGAVQELTRTKTIDRRALRNLLDLGLSLRCSHPGCSRAITRDTITSAGAICDHGA
jgi:hypothetical protein